MILNVDKSHCITSTKINYATGTNSVQGVNKLKYLDVPFDGQKTFESQTNALIRKFWDRYYLIQMIYLFILKKYISHYYNLFCSKHLLFDHQIMYSFKVLEKYYMCS